MNSLKRHLPPHFPLIAILLVLLVILTVGPVVMLLIGSVSEGMNALGTFTLNKYIRAYTDPGLVEVLVNTAFFAIGAALFSTTIGTFLSYLSVRTNIPAKGTFRFLPIIPMMFPHVLFSAAWIMLLNPTNGIFNVWIRDFFGILGVTMENGPFNIYTLWGMIFLQGMVDLPVTYLVVAPAMESFDPSMEEASRASGATAIKTLRKITLPMLRPAILAAFALGVVRSLAAFAVPSMVGMPGRVFVLNTRIYRAISTGWIPDYGRGAALGLLALSTSVTLVYVYRYLVAESERYVTVTGKAYRPRPIDLGRLRYVFAGILTVLASLLLFIPILVLIYMSFLPYNILPSARAFSLMGFTNWSKIFSSSHALRATGNTIFLALVGASLAILLSVFVAYVITKIKSRVSGVLESLSFLAFSFPGLIIGVGWMWLLVRTPLYATLSALLVAYVGTYLPYGVRPLTSAFEQIHQELEESSRVCGAGFLYTLKRIVVPLLAPGVMSAWMLLACMFVRELSVSVVLSRPGTEVLTVQILELSEDALWGQVAALGLVMVGISSALVIAASLVRSRLARSYLSE